MWNEHLQSGKMKIIDLKKQVATTKYHISFLFKKYKYCMYVLKYMEIHMLRKRTSERNTVQHWWSLSTRNNLVFRFLTTNVDWFCNNKRLLNNMQKSNSVLCPLRKINMFPLRKEGTKTRKHFLIFQKHLVIVCGCKALPICLQLVWCSQTDLALNSESADYKHFYFWQVTLFL